MQRINKRQIRVESDRVAATGNIEMSCLQAKESGKDQTRKAYRQSRFPRKVGKIDGQDDGFLARS
jgi:hypothetical protein